MILETHDGQREVNFNPAKAANHEFEVVDLMFENMNATTSVLIKELTKVRLHGDKTHMERDGKV